MNPQLTLSRKVVRAGGFEPPSPFGHQDLNLACFPGFTTPA